MASVVWLCYDCSFAVFGVSNLLVGFSERYKHEYFPCINRKTTRFPLFVWVRWGVANCCSSQNDLRFAVLRPSVNHAGMRFFGGLHFFQNKSWTPSTKPSNPIGFSIRIPMKLRLTKKIQWRASCGCVTTVRLEF